MLAVTEAGKVYTPAEMGINENIKVTWDSEEFYVKPGIEIKLSPGSRNEQLIKTIRSGVSANIPLNIAEAKKAYNFTFDINLKGSEKLGFIPLGGETNVELISDWQTPSFDGAFLPDEREVGKDGFKARWKVLQLNRNFPQSWKGKPSNDILDSAFVVKLLVPVDEYQKNERSVKYAIMFISLTFLIFFFVEVINKIRIHPIQYLLVGLALVLFFSLLLSLSEHLNFNLAYLIASIGTISAITLYSRNIFKNNRLTMLQGGVLAILYIFIFTILQLQDYALLMGSTGLFVVLAIVMFISRKIDWYAIDIKPGIEKEKRINEANI